jgi:hypothetical protein
LTILGTGKGNSVSHQPLLAGSASSAARTASGWRSRTAVAAATPRWREADLLDDAWHVTVGRLPLLAGPEKAAWQLVAAAAAAAAGGAVR